MKKPKLTILAEGEGWLAIDKPHDLSTHNSSPGEVDVTNWLAHELAPNSADKNSFKPQPVHRLDLGTSGVLLIALNKNMARTLAQTFEQGQVEKVYSAILRGKLETATIWNHPLTEKAEGRRDPAGSGPKKPSISHVQPVRQSKYFTLAEVRIETGRTHQIRRHAALAKHPVIGDTRYATQDHASKLNEIYGFNRLALHASKLNITISNKRFEICAPTPEEFVALMDASV